jgi:hypothetical protein
VQTQLDWPFGDGPAVHALLYTKYRHSSCWGGPPHETVVVVTVWPPKVTERPHSPGLATSTIKSLASERVIAMQIGGNDHAQGVEGPAARTQDALVPMEGIKRETDRAHSTFGLH